MAELTHTIPVSRLTKQIRLTVRLSGTSVLRVRLWLAAKVLALAGWIAGTQMEVEIQW